MYELPKTVEDAAKLLDKIRPSWYKEIVKDNLDMELNHRCILGQLYGLYSTGIRKLFPNLICSGVLNASVFGFENAKRLRKEWIMEIDKRRTPKPKPKPVPQKMVSAIISSYEIKLGAKTVRVTMAELHKLHKEISTILEKT